MWFWCSILSFLFYFILFLTVLFYFFPHLFYIPFALLPPDPRPFTQATEDEIKEAYKRLCRTFHPDKHVDQTDKLAAEKKFQVIQKAYEG